MGSSLPNPQMLAAWRTRVVDEIGRRAADLRRLGEEVHRDPELGCREYHAATRLCGELEEEGFEVETGIGGLETAFRARIAAGEGPTIAFLAEYDAVPGLGHGGGHNLIVVASIGAAVALRSVLDEVGGQIDVIGAPAEETIGGKVVLAVRGVFDGVDAALLAHPGDRSCACVESLASWSVEVLFEGRKAHAVAGDGEGINALEALIALFTARGRLLEEIGEPRVRIPGVIVEGGLRPNLVPDRARARFSLRAPETRTLVEVVLPRFEELVESIARESGARASVVPIDNLYDEMISNPLLARLWRAHASDVGERIDRADDLVVGSLDMGTVSCRIPALHPTFAIVSEPTPTNTEAFVRASSGPTAYGAALRAARCLALTGLDLLADPALLDQARTLQSQQLAGRPPRIDAPLVVEQQEP